jgi:bifunctional DNA-binding transcriptional regulator/antitoxin component of YhaV-PrlF toxin-antitoxin module
MVSTSLQVSDDGVLTIPDAMLEELGWKEGDELEWTPNDDGSFTLSKNEGT